MSAVRDSARPHLAGRSGIDVLVELRAEAATRDVAIVVVTWHAHLLTEAQLAEIDGVVDKPFDIPELMATVQRAVLRAATRHIEVPPVVAVSWREPPVRPRRAHAIRRTRGRR